MAERTALVTGCSSGFGLGIARLLAERGWTVYAGVRDPARADLRHSGVRVLALDLADERQIDAAAANINRLDCLVNNAGFALSGPFSTYTAAQMRHQMQVNVLGPAFLTQRLLPALTAARGRVINLSSLAGEFGLPMNSLYCATKFALEGLSEALRHELRPHGVQVALVEPGGFRTRFVENMVWGERPLPVNSLAAKQLTAYRGMQSRMLAKRGRDPAAVVDAVVRLAEMDVMPARTRIGADAKGLRLLGQYLPDGMVGALVDAMFGAKNLSEPYE